VFVWQNCSLTILKRLKAIKKEIKMDHKAILLMICLVFGTLFSIPSFLASAEDGNYDDDNVKMPQ